MSDNGNTFKVASKTFEEMMRHEKVQPCLPGLGARQSFNLARAPSCEGVFERMISMIKCCLSKIVGRARLSPYEFTTMIAEAINCRTISYLLSDDTDEPLTPAHLLCGRRFLSLPDSICYTDHKEE